MEKGKNIKKTASALRNLLAAGLAVVLPATISHAAINVTFGGSAAPSAGYGLVSAVSGASTIDFNSIDLANQTTTYVYDNGNPGQVNFTGLTAGSGGSFVIGDSPSQYKAPDNDTTRYLSVGGARSNFVTMTFTNPTSYFGLYWSTPDTYNSLTFKDAGGNTLLAYSPAASTVPSVYVNFTNSTGAVIKSIEFRSSSAALESDNFAYLAVPEPSVPALLALVGTGFVIFRRRSSAS